MKGQVSVEYVVFVSIIMALFAVVSYSAIAASKTVGDENDIAEARKIASLVGQEVNLAVEVGSGYGHEFYLQSMLSDGKNFSVNFSSRLLTVSWNNGTYTLPVLAANITGNVSKGMNSIKNQDGLIAFG